MYNSRKWVKKVAIIIIITMLGGLVASAIIPYF